MKPILLSLLVALLGGCASTTLPGPPPHLDHSYTARSQSSRVKFVVLHYTVSDTPRSIKILTEQVVSSHYLLTDTAPPRIYALVDESRQANHAGVSNWKNYTLLNSSSVGIEIVNPGYTDTPEGRLWHPFPQAQIDELIALLKQIVARHNIPPENILGHNEIAPQRKQDPGPMFPWRQLAAAGLVAWPDGERVAAQRALYERQLPDTAWFQQRLAQHGYALAQTGTLDGATRDALVAFQMKFRQSLFAGIPDAETAAILDVLTTPAGAPAPLAVK
ncbi:N-acetylmuramoyl-L-alanine amidase [Janthinobacterium fluminis]|uniref:N-acetylmuramoyl-L-alanine amidase n=1 Tax=Janthinobacterium fluminis TaxID=2987524 RepID=A0ABT5K0G0_9BURK|nr:N-acetylmuramoyl-L-alanine amidase [Janthinobacterium fluminis]MDC8757945.1 N-acetylmuramoyl-L-alanine amidase [Janthinobacterium fluminis]